MHQDVEQRQKRFYLAIQELMTTSQPHSPTIGPDTDKMETVLMPAVRKPVQKVPPHIYYRRQYDNPLLLLFGAILKCNQELDRIPAVLFVTDALIPDLEKETLKLTGKRYDGHFRMFYPGAIDGRTKIFPVFPESQLPDFLRRNYGKLTQDSVIAIVEC